MSIRKGMSVLIVLSLVTTGLRAQDAARAIIDKAVQAHGGTERLSRVRADKVQVKGSLFVEGKETPFTGETIVQLPGQFKNMMQVATPKGRVTLVQILNGDKAIVTIDGQPQKVEAAALAEMRETFQLNRAVRLVPLLTDRTYELAVLPEVKVNDRPALGVRVTAKGKRELRLFFDKETGLLVKTEHTLDAGEGKEVRQEVYYGDFRDVGGYKRPAKLLALRDGKKVMEAELSDVRYFEKIDDVEFTKP
jgi:negative regulator of sigma E activity